MAPTTTVDPITHDEQLVALWAEESKAEHTRRIKLHYLVEATHSHLIWGERKKVTVEQAFATVEDLLDAPDTPDWKVTAVVKARDEYTAAQLALIEVQARVSAHSDAYEGWSRFFLVTSSPGHVHSSMSCRSCKANTTFALLPALSGKGEADAVTLLGQALCTVCFPSAPVDPIKIPKGIAEKAGTPGFGPALAKWQAKVEADNAHKMALAAEGKRKRPRKPRDVGWAHWLKRFPESDGWY